MCGLSCHKIGRRQRYTSSPTRLSPETIPIDSLRGPTRPPRRRLRGYTGPPLLRAPARRACSVARAGAARRRPGALRRVHNIAALRLRAAILQPHFIDRWRPANDNATLTVYVPIDKSGSTTVRGALLRSRAWGLCILGRPGTRAQGDPVCRGDAIAIGSYGDCRAVAPRKCQYFTVLRDPVARRVSEYDWFCRACKEGNQRVFDRAHISWASACIDTSKPHS